MRLPTATAMLLLTAIPLAGQGRDRGPLVLELPANTRALAMGTAFAIGSSDADAVFHNPAMSAAAGLSLGVHRYGGASLLSLSGGTDWFGGRIGVGLQTLEYGVSEDARARNHDAGVLVASGPVAISEHVASVSYARRIRGLRLGLSGKLIDQRVGTDRAVGGAIDVSTGVQVARLNLGLAVQNLGPAVDLGPAEVGPPLRATLGAAFSQPMPLGPIDLFVAAAVSREADGTVVPVAGVEVGYWPIAGRTFFARFGARDPLADNIDWWTAGAGFSGDRITLDYAFEPFANGRDAHRLGLRWR